MKRKRSTADIFDPLDEAELDELDRFLLSDATSDETLTLASLDGFMTALAIGPRTVMPSEWLPEVWGGEDFAPEFESTKDFEHVFSMLLRHMNSVVAEFQHDPKSFEPIVDVMMIEDREYAVGESWVLGFMRAVDLNRDDWQPLFDSPETADAVRLLHILGSEDATEEELDLVADPEDHAALTRKLPAAIAAIHAFWLPYRNIAYAESTLATPLRRAQPKVGRNDPCPCGSGVKYKKCCGAPATKH